MVIRVVGIYTLLHFLVDFACGVLLYHQAYPFLNGFSDVFYAFLLYNFFAFAVQLPIGIIADYVNKNALFAVCGCFLVLCAYILAPLGIIACIIAGIGNACFHIGGGIDVLNLSKGKATLPGIFVSSGALGIFLSAQKFLNQPYIAFVFMGLMALGCALSYIIYHKFHKQLKNTTIETSLFSNLKLFMIYCLCLTVLLRSYTGFVLSFEWKSVFVVGLLFTMGIVLGKMLGGIIGDKFGLKKTAVLSLLLSAGCFCFAFQNNTFGIISGIFGVLLFNMTMPITLTALTNLMPQQKGMAFGLLTFMLFLGSVPCLFGHKYPFFSPIGLSVLVLLSAVVLFCGLIQLEKD